MSIPAVCIAVATTLFGLTGCSTPPWTVSRSPETITLRWYTDETDVAAAQSVADSHCRSYGKIAALTSDERSGSIEVAEFRCR